MARYWLFMALNPQTGGVMGPNYRAPYTSTEFIGFWKNHRELPSRSGSTQPFSTI